MPHLGGGFVNNQFQMKGISTLPDLSALMVPEVPVPTAQAVESECVEQCVKNGGIRALCRFSCGLEERSRSPLKGLTGGIQTIVVIVLGIILIIVALTLITR